MKPDPRDSHALPPRIVDPTRIDVRVQGVGGVHDASDAVAALTRRARLSAVSQTRFAGRDRRVVIGRPGLDALLDRVRFPHGAVDLAFCSLFEGRITFAWAHDHRSFVMSVATSSTIGIPARPRARIAVLNVLDTVGCLFDVATGRIPNGRPAGEAAARVGTTARLAAIGCCQSGDRRAAMNFADERVVGAGRPAMLPKSTLTLSSQGAALIPQLPSTVALSIRGIDEDATFIDVHAPMIQERMPDDPMDRLRIMADAEGLPILYRWTRT